MTDARGRQLSRQQALALRDSQWHAYAMCGQAHNPGLALERYQPVPRGTAEPDYSAFLREVCELAPAPIYAEAYEEWKATLLGMPGVRAREFETRGRVIVGLGAESVRETGITLLRLYGVPVLPGSALKGLARRYLEARGEGWSAAERDEITRVMFGQGTERKGAYGRRDASAGSAEPQAWASHLVYFDAWYVPGSAPQDRPLRRDIITVHHPRYYRGQGKAGGESSLPPVPWDLDDPNPVAFVSARGRYLVAVRGPDAAGQWAEQALMILERALADWGIGAKTSSGYGRLVPVGDLMPLSPEKEAAQNVASSLVAEIQAINVAELAEPELKARLKDYATTRLNEVQDAADKMRIRRAVFDKVKEAGKLQAWKGEQWLSRLATVIGEKL